MRQTVVVILRIPIIVIGLAVLYHFIQEPIVKDLPMMASFFALIFFYWQATNLVKTPMATNPDPESDAAKENQERTRKLYFSAKVVIFLTVVGSISSKIF